MPVAPSEPEVRRETVLPAGVDEVWDALTSEALLEEWLADEVELEAEVGGSVTLRFEDGEERRGVVDEVVEGERLALRWWRAAGPETRVEFIVEAVSPGRTRLVVAERLVVPSPITMRTSVSATRLAALPRALSLVAAA